MMTRKDFVAVAQAIAGIPDHSTRRTAAQGYAGDTRLGEALQTEATRISEGAQP